MSTSDTNERRVRTTVTLTASTMELIDQVIATSKGKITRAEFVEHALREYLAKLERNQIDLAFAGMADDDAYQKQARLISEDFEGTDEAI